jgi:HKD family nuclease
MNVELKDGSEASKFLKEQMCSSQTARLAVAFWGAGAIEALMIKERIKLGLSTQIVLNLAQGGTNPNVVKKLKKLSEPVGNLEVKQSDFLHAKVYLFDSAAMIGSSNASANGLAFEGNEIVGWDEANIVICDNEQLQNRVSQWFESTASRDITREHIESAQERWNARRKSRGAAYRSNKSLLDDLRDQEVCFDGCDIHLVFYNDELTEIGKNAEKKVQRETGSANSVFEDWDDLPGDASLICFLVDKNEIRYDDIWSTKGAGACTYEKTRIQPVFPAEKDLFLTKELARKWILPADQRWSKIVEWLRSELSGPEWESDSSGVCIKLETLSTAIKNGSLSFSGHS